MSYRLWQQRYEADPSVIGTVFDVNQKPFTVIGITPPGFFGDQVSFLLSDGDRGSSPDFRNRPCFCHREEPALRPCAENTSVGSTS